MSARADIGKILAEWRKLTLAEGGAIQAAAWSRVSQIQSRKRALQKTFDAVRDQSESESSIRAELGRLLSLEERNRAWLAEQLQRARAEQDSLDQSYRNLRKIQRSYVRKPAPMEWQCIS